jgi:hypothetical protein
LAVESGFGVWRGCDVRHRHVRFFATRALFPRTGGDYSSGNVGGYAEFHIAVMSAR